METSGQIRAARLSVPDKSYTKITTHRVFDVKLGTLTRKARLCADGHRVPTLPKESTYSSVPSRDSARMFFSIGSLEWTEGFVS